MYDHTLFVQTLSAFTHTLLTPYDTQTLLEELTERVGVVFGLTGSGVMLAVEGHLTLASAVPAAVADLERVQEDEESGPSWDAFRTGIPVAVADLGAHEHGWGRVREEAERLGLRSVAALPMRLGEWSVGTLSLAKSDVTSSIARASSSFAAISAVVVLRQSSLNQPICSSVPPGRNLEVNTCRNVGLSSPQRSRTRSIIAR